MDDLISRKAVIDVLNAILPVDPVKNEYTQGITCGVALAIGYVKQLPSAQPERPKGKWIHRGCGMFECDQCGKKLISNVYTCEGAGRLYKYCPGCGADMRGEQDEQAT